MIYLIEAMGLNAVKIGYTDTAGALRMATLQTGCPAELVLLAEIQGEREDEKRLHYEWRQQHLRGEWFSICPGILRHFNVECTAESASEDAATVSPAPLPSNLRTIEHLAECVSQPASWLRNEILDGWVRPTPWGRAWYVDIGEFNRFMATFATEGRRPDAPRFDVTATRRQLLVTSPRPWLKGRKCAVSN